MKVPWILFAVTVSILLRQLFVFGAIYRSASFLGGADTHCRNLPSANPEPDLGGSKPTFYIIVPVLREAESLAGTTAHFERMQEGHGGTTIVVTTQREFDERRLHPLAGDTVAAAAMLSTGMVKHLHLTKAGGTKADQINLAIDYCSAEVPAEAADNTFIVIYDADSRPPLDSLDQFAASIDSERGSSIFHQSSRFLIPREGEGTFGLLSAIAASGALRANRFVLAYELPRLRNRMAARSFIKRKLCSLVFTHVTGHGLCLRLTHATKFKFPAGVSLEDMWYSFRMCAEALEMTPISSLDSALVPASVGDQVQQLSRWFIGPARFGRYRREQAAHQHARSIALAASAAGITLGWLSCAVLPVGLATAAVADGPYIWVSVGLIAATIAAQLVVTDRIMSPGRGVIAIVASILAFPISCTLFGFAGLLGLRYLRESAAPMPKTERYDEAAA